MGKAQFYFVPKEQMESRRDSLHESSSKTLRLKLCKSLKYVMEVTIELLKDRIMSKGNKEGVKEYFKNNK